MNKLFKFTRTIPFHFKWLFMSPEERYAFLWGRTRNNPNFSYLRRNIMTPAHYRR